MLQLRLRSPPGQFVAYIVAPGANLPEGRLTFQDLIFTMAYQIDVASVENLVSYKSKMFTIMYEGKGPRAGEQFTFGRDKKNMKVGGPRDGWAVAC